MKIALIKSDPFNILLFIIFGAIILMVVIVIIYAISSNPQKPRKEVISSIFTTPSPISTINIVLYGHSGCGKSTFIQKTFTTDQSDLVSTEEFRFYEFEREPSLNSKDKVLIRIADYRGQSPEQLTDNLNGIEVNAILFLVDIAPSYNKEGVLYRNNELINFMINKGYEDIIIDRVKDHEQYLNKFLLRIILRKMMNKNLRSIYFMINKTDILKDLQTKDILSKEIDIEAFAKSFFVNIEGEINRFCSTNKIRDFKTFCISAKEYNNLQKVASALIDINKNSQNG